MPRTFAKNRRSRTSCSIFALATALAVGASPAGAQSFQGNWEFKSGTGNVTTPNANTTAISITSPQAVIEWTPHDNAINNGVPIVFQPANTFADFSGSGNYAVLNNIAVTDFSRVVELRGTIRTVIAGAQTGSGSIYFYSPSGFLLTGTSVVNVGSAVFSALPINVDGNGIFINGADRSVSFGGSAFNPTASVTTDSGAQITATGTGNSYVAMVAPRVVHNGSISVNGSAALVAAEAATINFSPDGLFDIQVDVGTSNADAMTIGGSIGGPASIDANTDKQRIFAVAIPKNQAMTLLISGGANLGFDIAGAASVEGNAVVLSAGHDIEAGQIETARSPGGGSGTSDLLVYDTDFTSRVDAAATSLGLFVADNTTANMASNLTLRAANTQFNAISSGVHQVAGSVTLISDNLGFTAGANGGNAFVTALDGSINIAGDLIINSRGFGAAGETGTGGSVNIGAYEGGTINVTNLLRIDADGFGGSGALGTGGNIDISAGSGSSIHVGLMNAHADGQGGINNGAGAGAGQGGNATIRATGPESAITISNTLAFPVPLQSRELLSADGFGGSTSLGGTTGGTGTGGAARIRAEDGGSISLPTTGEDSLVRARGYGGIPAADGTTGGLGVGGIVELRVDGGTVTGGKVQLSSIGQGGEADAQAPYNSNGGDGTGGERHVNVLNGGSLTIALPGGVAGGVGGFGTGTGDGGDGTGGWATLTVDNAIATFTGNTVISNQASGGYALGSGNAGSADAGHTNAVISNGGVVNIASGNELLIASVAYGGGSFGTGASGNAVGGDTALAITNATVAGAGALTISSAGESLGGGGAGGTGQGGNVYVNLGNATINPTIFVTAAGLGGSGNVGGAGTGGTIDFISYANTTIGTGLTLDASGYGGAGSSDAGGDGMGGRATLSSSGGLLAIAGNVDILADGHGGDGATGGDGIGGGEPMVNFYGSHIYAYNGAITVGGDASVSSSGFGGDGINGGDGGDGSGGYATIHAANSNAGPSSISINGVESTTSIVTEGHGGAGGEGASGNTGGDGGAGGTGAGGFSVLTAAAGNGTVNVRFANLSSQAYGGDGGDGGNGDGGPGGSGGAGGDAIGGGINVGTESGLAEATVGNLGFGNYGSIFADASATAGDGGAGSFGSGDGSGGAGGVAEGGWATLLVRGSTANVTGNTTLIANASGGDGGFGGGETGLAGAGGDGVAGAVGVLSTSRYLIDTQHATLNAGPIIGTAIASGGDGSVSGSGIVGPGSSFETDRSTVNIASLDFTVAGDSLATDAEASAIQLTNSMVTVGSYNFATTGDLALYVSDSLIRVTDHMSISAADFVSLPGAPTPSVLGTIHAGSASIATGNNFIATGNFVIDSSFSLYAPGAISADSFTVDGDLFMRADGGNLLVDDLTASGYIDASADGDFTASDVDGGDSVRLSADNGALLAGDISSATWMQFFGNTGVNLGDLDAGTSINGESNAQMLLGDILAGNDVNLDAAGAINAGSIQAGFFHANAGADFTSGNIVSDTNILIYAGGGIVAENLAAGLNATELSSMAIHLDADGSIDVGTVTADGGIMMEAGSTIDALDVTSGEAVLADAGGNITLGNISSGLVNPQPIPEGGVSVAITSDGGDILLGNIAAAGHAGLAAPGTITAGDIDAGGIFMALGHGDMNFGDATASEVFLSDYQVLNINGLRATCIGNCGTIGASGVVTSPPTGSFYSYVTTEGGVEGAGQLPGFDDDTNGSVYTTSEFTVDSGEALDFWFNYVTSDGSGFADYAWAALLTPNLDPVAILFTARTQPSGTIVPGQGLPGVEATLDPSSVPIIGGAPTWNPLGSSSGTCYDAGCGYTGWVSSTYNIADAGDYVLQFGVTNWSDTSYQSGMAFSGLSIGGVSLTPVLLTPTGGSITIGDVNTGKFSAAAGTSLTTGIIDTTGSMSLGAGAAITTGNLFAGDFVLANGGSITTGNIDANSVDMASSGGNITTGNITVFGEVELNAFADMQIGDVVAGSIDLLAGNNIATGDLTTQYPVFVEGLFTTLLHPGASITLEAGGNIATGDIDSIDGVYADAGGNLTPGTIEANDFVDISSAGNMATGNINAGSYLYADAGGTMTLGTLAANDIELESGGNMSFASANVASEIDFSSGGSVSGGNVVAGSQVSGDAAGNVTLANLTVTGSPEEGEDFSVGISAIGNISVGNVDAYGPVGFATQGNLTTGSILAGDLFMTLVGGNTSINGSINTGGESGGQVYMADDSMFLTGGGTMDGDDDFDPDIVLALSPVATGGSIAINGAVSTGQFEAAAGTSLTTQAITTSGDIHASAGGTATINGVWSSGGDVELSSNDIDISNTGGINAAGSVGLFSTNATQALIGDGLTGSGYALSNAEFGRISGTNVGIGARGDASAAIDMLIGDLTVTGPLVGSTIEGSEGILAFAVGDIDTETVSGVIRVKGNFAATGFGPGNAIEFYASRFELDAATGSVSILSSGSTLGGELGLYADRIHVAAGAILDQLASNPTYSNYQQDLNKPATVQRPEGVLRADTLWIESDNLQGVLVQNTGTAAAPAGFLVREAYVNEDYDTAGPAGSINLIVNGQVVTEGGTLAGIAARDALITPETDITPFAANSTINGCPLTGQCIIRPPAPPPTSNLVENQIDLIGRNPIGESEFDDNQEGEEGSSNPIAPPQPLFDTRPLVPTGDVDDPVSGTGNPALLGSEAQCEEEENGQCAAPVDGEGQ